jgi:hypothetical protein
MFISITLKNMVIAQWVCIGALNHLNIQGFILSIT